MDRTVRSTLPAEDHPQVLIIVLLLRRAHNLLDRAVEDGLLDASTRKAIIVEREPVVLIERLIPALTAE